MMSFLLAAVLGLGGEGVGAGQDPAFNDYQNMLEQLGVKSVRRGPDPNAASTFDEAGANRIMHTLPELMAMKDGSRITTRGQWEARRKEVAADFEREVYGKIPEGVPGVVWSVASESEGTAAGVATVTRVLEGKVDNSAYPSVSVTIRASVTVPKERKGPVPTVILFGFGFGGPRGENPWTDQAIAAGFGYAVIQPGSIQPDNNRFDTGIIGLTKKGRPRLPDEWGALRAWQWGTSRLIDAFESHADWGVDAKRVGIAGLSRYGKAAVVTQAFDQRVAFGFIGSSGQGGTKLHRHLFGEAVENLAGGLYYWMAGNYIKYGASEPEMTAADLPVDSHQLVALCAPRPVFISHGVPEKGDANWIDARGSWMSAILAGQVYRLYGKEGFGDPAAFLTEAMPPVGTLVGKDLAWRQHEGGHDLTPNWPAFFEWAKVRMGVTAGL